MKHCLEIERSRYVDAFKDHHVRWSEEHNGFIRFTWDRSVPPYGGGREELIR